MIIIFYSRKMNSRIGFFIFIILTNIFKTRSIEIDENGYLTYCPCMGRFGNQADHFLGALAFTKALNRTLVLPPWVEYRYGETRSLQVPFDTYFDVESLKDYHKVITMETFFESLADAVWPPEQRISFCYTVRTGTVENSCNAKDGNPFGPFWDTFNVEFTKSEFYAPLHYDIHRMEMLYKWQLKYRAEDWPVLAFTGAPASFPVQDENRPLQKYLKWNEKYNDAATSFIKSNMSKGAFVGIHLRNGADWTRACQHVAESPLLFAAPQCVGYRNEKGPLTASMCFPSKQDIVRQLKRTLKQVKDVKHIFVASDANHMIEELREALRRSDVISILQLEKNDPHLDLAILGSANHFIGNCVSSYSAFVKRERDVRGLPSSFWAFPALKIGRHEEL